MSSLDIINWGLIPYHEAHQRQLDFVERRLRNEIQDSLILCSHPPVVTLGKLSEPEDLLGWTGEVVRVERGGRATYHGPGQLVIYPILHLKNYELNLSGLLRALEASIVNWLGSLGLVARGNPNYAGVWVKTPQGTELKVASIGLAVRRWVTYHGLALNLTHDQLAFQGIRSCGHQGPVMTNLEQLGLQLERECIERGIVEHFMRELEQLPRSSGLPS